MDNKVVFEKKKIKSIDDCDLGISGENEQETLIFLFEDGFVNGTGYLEIEFPNGCCGRKCSIELVKDLENECYKLEVKNSLLRFDGKLKMQLKIVEKTAVWKSVVFEMLVDEAINATESIEEDYPDLIKWLKTRMSELEEGVEQLDKKVDRIEIPTKLSDLENDLEFESFSGDYNDLKNKPEIPDTSNFITNVVDNLVNYYIKNETYTQEEVIAAINNRINELVNGAPETFDTLKEIADYIAEHEEISKTLNEAIGNKANKADLAGLATEEYVNNKIGDIDAILSDIASESEAI